MLVNPDFAARWAARSCVHQTRRRPDGRHAIALQGTSKLATGPWSNSLKPIVGWSSVWTLEGTSAPSTLHPHRRKCPTENQLPYTWSKWPQAPKPAASLHCYFNVLGHYPRGLLQGFCSVSPSILFQPQAERPAVQSRCRRWARLLASSWHWSRMSPPRFWNFDQLQ